ncbi:MAG: YdeI/OmpD-associated family protein [Leeuwenhoekiella sp.]
MDQEPDRKSFYANSQKAWRDWLAQNHQTEDYIWLIIYKKKSKIPSVYYSEAVDEALCFGWIDSKPNKRDAESYYQYFAKRNPKSGWSRVNKEKVKRLITTGKMTQAGRETIEDAKQSGTWTALDKVEALIVPDDLQQAFSRNPKAFQNFENFPPSSKKIILEWVYSAIRPETRKRRIQETVALAKDNVRANHYRR